MHKQRLYPTVLAAVGTSALLFVYIVQFGFGYEPCVLCLYQRLPYAVIMLLGFAGLWRPHLLGVVFLLAPITFAIGAALAAYHVGVEQQLWASATGCSGDTANAFNVQDLMQSMQVKPVKACDAVDWTFLKLSMAAWNVVFSILFTGVSLYAQRKLKET